MNQQIVFPQADLPATPITAERPAYNTGAEPDWYVLALGMARAILQQRASRQVHKVGRDGRVRFGCVDLLACNQVDDAARAFCDALGVPFNAPPPLTEEQAMAELIRGQQA
jgi:hypothetical protein